MSDTGQSVRLGTVELEPGGKGYELFEALVEIECWECGRPIEPGERFTRLTRPGGGKGRHPICETCAPHGRVELEGPMSVRLERRYHVPRSQVWEGSRGRQSGNVHLHVTEPLVLGRIRRAPGQALCGRRGWFERPPEFAFEHTDEALCERCVQLAARLTTDGASGGAR